MKTSPLPFGLILISLAACAGSTPPAARELVAEKKSGPPPPAGPTRTDFKKIAQKLVGSCVAGGWISRWRSTAPDVDQARPRIWLRPFEDKTGQDLDPEYLNQELERRMRMSGVFDMVAEGAALDFFGRGKLLRLAERSGEGRISVYTATLELIDPATEKIAYSCEATVKGEM